MYTGGIGASSAGAGTMYYTNRLQSRSREETASDEFAANMAGEALEMFDQDGDGVLSADEFDADIVARADSDGDGYLNQEELEADARNMKPPPPPQGGLDQLLGQMQMLMQSDDAESSAEALASQLMDILDGDGDGVISADEMEDDDNLAAADSDGDGAVTTEELEASILAGMQGGGGGSDGLSASVAGEVFDSLDTNQDGVVSADELAAAGYSDEADRDGDGSVTLEELQADLEEKMASSPPPPPSGMMGEDSAAAGMSGQMAGNNPGNAHIGRLYEMLSGMANGYYGSQTTAGLNIIA